MSERASFDVSRDEVEKCREIVKAVADMRRWQKQYSGSRKQRDLVEARRCEVIVDNLLWERRL